MKIVPDLQPDYPADIAPIVFGAKPQKKNYLHEWKLDDTSYSQIAYQAFQENRLLGEAYASATSGPNGHTEAYAKNEL